MNHFAKTFTTLILLLTFCTCSKFLYAQDILLKAYLQPDKRSLPLYGFNGNNSNGPSYNDAAFRSAITSLNIKAIRYPGGSISNWWDWQNGWFEQADFQGTNNPFKNFKKYDLGLNALKLVVDQTHADVVFTLNMVSRDVNDQVAMLEYANKIGIPVKFIELGNEFDINKSIGRKVYSGPQDYGAASERWIDAIKQKFPAVKIAVIGGNLNYDDDVKNWNDIVLKAAANADAVIAHLYPVPENVTDNSGINFQKLYNAEMDMYQKLGFFNLPKQEKVWVTEYNIQWGKMQQVGGALNSLQQKSDATPWLAFTWSQSLATLFMTSFFSGLPNTEMVINHNIASSLIFAAINTRDSSFSLLPNGIGMQYWLNACNGKNSLQKIGFKTGNKNDDAKDFQVFGWRFGSETSTTILCVNLTEQPETIDFSQPGNSKSLKYKISYADKNKTVNSMSDISTQENTSANGIVLMPPFSVAVLQNN